jgi:glutamate-ammonia-ligase adenylyltransferase
VVGALRTADWPGRAPADVLVDRPDAAARLASLAAASVTFTDQLVAEPRLAAGLAHPLARQDSLFPGDPAVEAVRVAAAYAAGELAVPDLGRRLAALADAVVAQAVANARPPMPFAAIALGSFGAQELSFGSDLDVVFVHGGEGPDAFAAAASAAERVLEGIRSAGWVPDPDLRPEGRNGPLVRSLASYLEYWQRWAQTWEFQTLLRARFVAGDDALGRRFTLNAHDVAAPPTLSPRQVAEIRRMRVRMEQERVRPPDARRFHLKLGYGGLADVQFAVELSVMRHGSAHPSVRVTGTPEALEALVAEGLVDEPSGRALHDAHIFLTNVRAAMELERRLPADRLPSTPEAQAALARRLGYDRPARQQFLNEYRRVTWRARLAMDRVFYGER